ncbi:MAG: deaminase [Thermodesulfobacteriota bacterium]
MWTKSDDKYMQMAMILANECKSEIRADPAPKVGVIIVKNDVTLAEAYRGQDSTGDHAEFVALHMLNEKQRRGATLYTTLEPCVGPRTEGKKPCAQWIVEQGIIRVVIGTLDRNPYVLGKGWCHLIDNKVEVEFAPSIIQLEIENKINSEYVKAYRRNWITIAPRLDMQDFFSATALAIRIDNPAELRGTLNAFLRGPKATNVGLIRDVLGSISGQAERSDKPQKVIDEATQVWLDALDSNREEAVTAAIYLRDMMMYFRRFPSQLTKRLTAPRPLTMRLISALAQLSYDHNTPVPSEDAWHVLTDRTQPLALRMISAWIIGFNRGSAGSDRHGVFIIGTKVLLGLTEEFDKQPLPLQQALFEALDIIPRIGGGDTEVLRGLRNIFEGAQEEGAYRLKMLAARSYLDHYPVLRKSLGKSNEQYAQYEKRARKIVEEDKMHDV